MNILFLTDNAKTISSKHIINAAKKAGHAITAINPNHLILSVSAKKHGNTKDVIYYNGDKLILKEYNVIIPRLGKLGHGANVLRHLTHNFGLPSTNNVDGLLNASNKWITSQLLSTHKVLTPKCVYLPKGSKLNSIKFVLNQLDLPIIGKMIHGSQGSGVFILESPIAAMTTLETITKNHNVLVQDYIETAANTEEQKRDIRAYVVGDKVVAAMMRLSTADDIRSNYSISKEAKEIGLTHEEITLAVSAAKAIGLDVAGVDIMRSTSDDYSYICEVNGNGSLAGITKITGIDVASYIVALAVSKAKALSKQTNYVYGLRFNAANETYFYNELLTTEELMDGISVGVGNQNAAIGEMHYYARTEIVSEFINTGKSIFDITGH